MRRVLIHLERDEFRILRELAKREERDIDRQAGLLLKRTLREAAEIATVVTSETSR